MPNDNVTPEHIEQDDAQEALRYLQAATTCRSEHGGRMERIFIEAAQRALEGRLNDMGRAWSDAIAVSDMLDIPRIDREEIEQWRKDHPPYDHQGMI